MLGSEFPRPLAPRHIVLGERKGRCLNMAAFPARDRAGRLPIPLPERGEYRRSERARKSRRYSAHESQIAECCSDRLPEARKQEATSANWNCVFATNREVLFRSLRGRELKCLDRQVKASPEGEIHAKLLRAPSQLFCFVNSLEIRLRDALPKVCKRNCHMRFHSSGQCNQCRRYRRTTWPPVQLAPAKM